MTSRHRGRYLLLLAVAGACGKSSVTAPPPTVPGPLTGSWVGGDSTVTLGLTLKETKVSGAPVGGVTGSGVLSGSGVSGGSVAVGATGKDSLNSVTLTLTLGGYQPAKLTGILDPGFWVDGTLDGSGFSNVVMRLYKQ